MNHANQHSSRMKLALRTILLLALMVHLRGADPLDNWIPQTAPDLREVAGNYEILSVTWGDGKFVAVGGLMPRDISLPDGHGAILSSEDGVNWQQQAAPGFSSIYPYLIKSVAWGSGRFVAVGHQTFLSSSNGVEWVNGMVVGDLFLSRPRVYDKVVHGAGVFLAVGNHPQIIYSPLPGGDSTAGLQWDIANTELEVHCDHLGPGIWACDPPIDAILWAGNQFLAYNGEAVSSWVSEECVAIYGDDPICVITEYEPRLISSSNGLVWQKFTVTNWFNPEAIAWNGSRFVAVGEKIWSSPDGTNWITHASGSNLFLNEVIWTGTQFVAVGNGGAILTSWDGARWRQRSSGTSADLFGVAFNGKRLVVVGADKTILLSAEIPSHIPVISEASFGDNAFHLRFRTVPGIAYRLQASENFENWQDIGQILIADGESTVASDSAPLAHTFYRIKLVEQ